MVVRKVANPAPSVLALVNPRKRRTKMATRRKRRHTTRRRVHRAAASHNPRRRRTTTHRRRRHSVFARRSHNPVRHHRRRHHRRRRNPTVRGAGGEILRYAGAGLGLGIFTPIVQRTVGGFLPFGQYNAPVITAGSGWLLSKIFEMIPFTRALAHPTLILGFSTAVIQVVQPFVRSAIGGIGAGAPANPTMANPMYRRGLRGIAAVPNTVPAGVPLVAPAPHPASGMQGIASYPTVGAFGRR